MSEPRQSLSMIQQAEHMCRQSVPVQKIEQLRNRPEKSATEKCIENHGVSEELKKQISELAHIRKSETVTNRITKIESAIDTLKVQTKPLKKALNSSLFSTDTELLELVAQTTRETLLEIGGSAAIDPIDVGMKVAAALKHTANSIKKRVVDKSEWCDEWILDEDLEEMDDLYDNIYKDNNMTESHRFAYRLGQFQRYSREYLVFSQTAETTDECYVEPAVYPFNVHCDFILQLVDVERIEKQKKVREKVERGAKKKDVGELVKVNDKASNVQVEEVSISKELEHVLKILKKELKRRKTDGIKYYEFVINPDSFSRTVENMFYISYLMRDREVYLVEESGIPILKRPTTTLTENETRQWESKNCTHGVTSLSYEQWQRLSNVFKTAIIEPLEG